MAAAHGNKALTQHEVAQVVRQMCQINISDAEVTTRPDIVRRLCEQTVGVVQCVDVRDMVQSPELEPYKEAMTELVLIKYATQMFEDFGIDFEPARDMYSTQPDPRRTLHVLTKITGILRFRDQVLKEKKFIQYIEPLQNLMANLDESRAKNDELELVHSQEEESCKMAKAAVEVQQGQLEAMQQDYDAREQTRNGLEQRNRELEREIEAAKAELHRHEEASAQARQEVERCRAILDEPPQELQRAIEDLERAIDGDKREIATLDERSRALTTRKVALASLKQSLSARMTELGKISEQRKAYKSAKQATKQSTAKLEQLRKLEANHQRQLKVCRVHAQKYLNHKQIGLVTCLCSRTDFGAATERGAAEEIGGELAAGGAGARQSATMVQERARKGTQGTGGRKGKARRTRRGDHGARGQAPADCDTGRERARRAPAHDAVQTARRRSTCRCNLRICGLCPRIPRLPLNKIDLRPPQPLNEHHQFFHSFVLSQGLRYSKAFVKNS